jgi:branched-chain amino acid transport system ATP-binding protein
VILKIKDITKNFGSLTALADVTFSVEKGEIFGIVGPNGAGKSTLFNVVAGFYTPSAGQVFLDGKDITGLKACRVCRAGLARTFQTPKTFPSLTVYENINIGATFGGRKNEKTEQIIEWLKLEEVAHAPAQNLNLLTIKLVMLGAALATDCKLLMLDEPMAGLTMVEINKFLELVREINNSWNITVIIIEHLLDILIGLTNRMLVLDNGRSIYLGPSDQVSQNQKVVDTYLGKKRKGMQSA